MDTGKNGLVEAGVHISFEVFPPSNDSQAKMLEKTIARLAGFKPAFFSLTYGAGGSSRERSLRTADMMRGLVRDPLSAHLTCAGASREDLRRTIRTFLSDGIKNFVALRGDPPTGVGTRYTTHPGGYADTAGLVADLVDMGARDVSVSAYPERHPESPDWSHEIAVLRRKADAGASRAITQFFFDNDDYERFRDRAHDGGVSIPIVPGILPIHDIRKVRQFAARCGAGIPHLLTRRFEDVEPGSELHGQIAAALAVEQVQDLMRRGSVSSTSTR